MKTPTLLLMVMLCMVGNSQSKPITITQKQIGQMIVLVATNNTTIEYEFELSVTSSGLKVNKNLPLLGHLNPREEKEVLTLSPIPGQKASYKYKLRPIPDAKAEEVIHQKASKRKKLVVANSARYYKEKAKQHVDNQLESQIVTVFTNVFCELCDDLLSVLDAKGISYNEKNITHSISNNELMWDALYVYGRKEGKVSLPIMVYKSKVYDTLTDLLEIKDQSSGH